MGELKEILQQRRAKVEPGVAQKQADIGSITAPAPTRRAHPNHAVQHQQAVRREVAQPYRVSVAQPTPLEAPNRQQTQGPFPHVQAQNSSSGPQLQPAQQPTQHVQQPTQHVRVGPPRAMNIQLSGSSSPRAMLGSRTPLSTRPSHPGMCGNPVNQVALGSLSRQVSQVDIAADRPNVPSIKMPVPGVDGRIYRHTIGASSPGPCQPILGNGEVLNSARTLVSSNVTGSAQLYDELSQLRAEKTRLMDENHQLREKARLREIDHRTEIKSYEDEKRRHGDGLILLRSRMEKLEHQNTVHLQQWSATGDLQEKNLYYEQNLELRALREIVTTETQRMRASLSGTSSTVAEGDAALQKEIQELQAREAVLRKEQLEFQSKFKDLENSLVLSRRESDGTKDEVSRLQDELSRRTEEIQKMNAALDGERARLKDERRRSEEQGWRLAEESAGAGAGTGEASVHRPSGLACSECTLRAAMTEQMVPTERLKQAIGGVEALLGEARRELATKQLRDKRAAHEHLHAAVQACKEDDLIKALEIARKAELDESDMSIAQTKLLELQSESEAVKAARVTRSLENERKRDAFHYVKKNDRAGLARCIENPDEDWNWKEWRDYMGRNLWKFSIEMRALDVQDYLRPLMGLAGGNPETPRNADVAPTTFQPGLTSATQPAFLAAVDEDTTSEATIPPAELESASLEESSHEAVPLPVLSEEEAEAVKKEAFRCVVQDNTTGLSAALDRLPLDIWSTWENKAGKSLITLSEERGSSNAYSLLAKRLGLTQDRKIEAFEEGETVWVYEVGDVQPKRATVREDSPAEEEEVLLEYWDGDDPASKVEKSMVRKVES